MTPAIITLGTYPSSRVSNETTHLHSQNHMPSLIQDNSNKLRNTDLNTGEGTGKIRIRAYKTEYGQTSLNVAQFWPVFFSFFTIYFPQIAYIMQQHQAGFQITDSVISDSNPSPVTYFWDDWSWNNFHDNALPLPDLAVSFWWKYAHLYRFSTLEAYALPRTSLVID